MNFTQPPAAPSTSLSPLGELWRFPSRGAEILAAIAISAAPLGPLLALLYLTEIWLGVSAAVVLVALLFAGVGSRQYPSRAVAAAAAFFLTLVAVAQVYFAPLGWMPDPAFFVLALIFAGAALAVRNRRKLLPAVVVAGLLTATASSVFALRSASWTLAAATGAGGVAVAAALWGLARRRLFARVTPLAIAFFTLDVMVFPRTLVVWEATYPDALARVLAQPGVRAVFSYQRPGANERIPPQTMVLARVPGTETFLISPHDPYTDLLVLTAGEPPKLDAVNIGSRSGDYIFFDPADANAAYMLARNKLLRIDTRRKRIMAATELGVARMPLCVIDYNADADAFLLNRSARREMYVVDRRSMKIRGSCSFPPWSMVDDARWDPVGHQIFAAGVDWRGWLAITYDAATLQQKKIARGWAVDWLVQCAVDPVGRRAYVGSWVTGIVRILDLDTLETVGHIPMEPGVRSFAFDGKRRCLLAASYWRGREWIYDAGQKKVLGSLFLGRRPRTAQIDPENGKWYVTTSVGGFEIDPDLALATMRRAIGRE